MIKKILTFLCFILSPTISFSTQIKVETFPLTQVRLLDGVLKQAQDVDLKYMLQLEPDKMLAPYYEESGLTPKAPKYGNWESRGIGGELAGHYLTAASQMYQSTGNEELLRRVNYMVSALAECQAKNGNGYVAGIPNAKQMWSDIANGIFVTRPGFLNNHWVPWYNLHKTLAGLRDAYLLTGNNQAKEILIKLADWCNTEVAYLSSAQMETMMSVEIGGMNEVLADVSVIAGDKKYLTLAQKFSHKAILEPLINHQDKLTGLHANTQIPKIIGFDRISELSGDTTWHNAATNFWNNVVNYRTVAFGGNSIREHFNPIDDYSLLLSDKSGPETCNTYNMLRLTKRLYTESNSLKYVDFYERALFNHILSSQHPERGGFVYLTSIHPQHYRVYSTIESNWCCVCTGLENHSKYGELIYSHINNDLFVNLFVASQLTWKEKGIIVTQETAFPESETSNLKLKLKKPSKFTINIRYPSWVKPGDAKILINGKNEKISSQPSTYIALNREWKSGDVITVNFPMRTTAEYLPDHSPWVAFLHGPIVLAAKTDTANLDNLYKNDGLQFAKGKIYPIAEAPMIVTSDKDFASKLKPGKGKNLTFTATDLIYPIKFKNLELIPFYKLHDARYMMYWQITSPENLEKTKQLNLISDKKVDPSLIVDKVAPGEQQDEIDHNFQSENSTTGTFKYSKWRDARGWFSFGLKDPNNAATKFQVMYYGKDNGREFDIFVNNMLISTQKLDGSKGDDFFTVDYKIPDDCKKDAKGLYLIKFVAKSNSIAGGVFNILSLKK